MRIAHVLIAVGGLISIGAGAPAPVPQRIVSLNMCADQLLVALADPGQIAGLTEWARDPELSAVAAQARSLPFTRHSAEEVMALHPDLVIGAPFRIKAILSPSKGRGIRMVEFPQTEQVGEIEAAIRIVADAVGHPQRGARLIAQMRRDLVAIGPPPGRGRVAAYYQRQGYLTGTGTLVDDMMRRVGLVNLAGRLGRPALSRLSLEELVLAKPAFVIMDSGTGVAADRGSAALHHPLLNDSIPAGRRLHIPEALIVCGGPAYPRAVAMLAGQVRAADQLAR